MPRKADAISMVAVGCVGGWAAAIGRGSSRKVFVVFVWASARGECVVAVGNNGFWYQWQLKWPRNRSVVRAEKKRAAE